MADGASEVSTSTRSRFAVSWEERQTSSACCSGESSSPNAAWMPPCAFAELHAWSEPFVASATRAPACSAETAAARPEAPLPITSTSKAAAGTRADDTSSRLIRLIRCCYDAGDTLKSPAPPADHYVHDPDVLDPLARRRTHDRRLHAVGPGRAPLPGEGHDHGRSRAGRCGRVDRELPAGGARAPGPPARVGHLRRHRPRRVRRHDARPRGRRVVLRPG